MNADEMRHIGARLETARKFRGVTMTDLEVSLDFETGAIEAIESGRRLPSPIELESLMTRLGIGVRFFHDGAAPKMQFVIAGVADRHENSPPNVASGALLEAIENPGAETLQLPDTLQK